MIRQAINQLLDNQPLSAEQAEGVMDQVMCGEATPAQIAGFLVALRIKGETVDEITGCARAMRRAAVRVTADNGTPQHAVVGRDAHCRAAHRSRAARDLVRRLALDA